MIEIGAGSASGPVRAQYQPGSIGIRLFHSGISGSEPGVIGVSRSCDVRGAAVASSLIMPFSYRHASPRNCERGQVLYRRITVTLGGTGSSSGVVATTAPPSQTSQESGSGTASR